MSDPNQTLTGALAPFEESIETTRDQREELYKWFHQHPELSLQEVETSARIEQEMTRIGYDVISGFVGSSDNIATAAPNHSPQFAPDLQPTLDVSVRTILTGMSPWLMQ